jgi:hypothetical protein
MTTTHVAIEFTAGDTWEILATLLDENGDPYDLTVAPEIKWTLVDRTYKQVLDEGDVSIITTDATAGEITILIPAEKTTGLAAGIYTDALRMIFGGTVGTLFVGPIHVRADPWANQAAAGVVVHSRPRIVASK